MNLTILKLFFVLFSGFLMFDAFALEIDERLTMRVLKTSDSKRTILINRGLEDGITVDDHVKFYLTTGVLARGVAIRVAPTRSIWSLYRLVDSDGIYEGRVMNLKKTRPIDLTADRSRELDLVDRGGAIEVPATIRLAPGAHDLPEGFDPSDLTEADRDDFRDLRTSRLETPSGRLRQTWEVWGQLSFSAMTTNSDIDEGQTFDGSNTNMDVTVGIEKYGLFNSDFLGKMSFSLFIHRSNQKATTVLGSEISLDALGYGVGANYHFINDPQAFGQFIGYASLNAGVGQSSDQVIFQSGSSTVEEDPLDGTFNFFSVGVGLKYYLSNGFGFRGLVDYYQRAESYLLDDDSEYTKTLGGPRVQAGISWRW